MRLCDDDDGANDKIRVLASLLLLELHNDENALKIGCGGSLDRKHQKRALVLIAALYHNVRVVEVKGAH